MSTAEHVVLMCHAEGDPAFRGSEHDRPLSARGRAQALAAARALHERGHHPGPLLVSTAEVARQTAAIMAEELRIPDNDIFLTHDLQDASPERLEAEISTLAVPYTLVTVIGHHPAVSDLARFLSRNPGAPDFAPAEWRLVPWPSPY